MAPIKVGVIGYGGGAKTFHLPFINSVKDLELIAILQRAEAPKDKASTGPGVHCTVDFPNIRHYRTEQEFFADKDIELVVVETRTDTHAYFAEKAIEAGKHAVVDKPFAESAERADKVIAAAKAKNLIVTCYQNRRWDGDFVTLRGLLAKKALGEVMEAELHYDFEDAPWTHRMTTKEYKPGDGMAFGLGSHSLDWALTLFGTPKSVTGFYRNQRGIESEVEDTFTIVLQYGGAQKELLVTVKTCIVTPMVPQLKYVVRGTGGSYFKLQEKRTCLSENSLAEGLKPLDKGFGVEPEWLYGTLTTVKEFDPKVQKLDEGSGRYVGKYPTTNARWMGYYENIAAAIRGTAELEVKPEQSRNVLRTVELARESNNTGRTVEWR